MASAKITVIKKVDMRDLFGENPPPAVDTSKISPQCAKFEEGQEFLLDTDECPPGFCDWAYTDIQRDLVYILSGGDHSWMKDKGVSISCCTDGLMPVIFKIERTEKVDGSS